MVCQLLFYGIILAAVMFGVGEYVDRKYTRARIRKRAVDGTGSSGVLRGDKAVDA